MFENDTYLVRVKTVEVMIKRVKCIRFYTFYSNNDKNL